MHRIFPFGITVGALTVAFIVILLLLISQRQMLPQTVILLTFVLFALYLTGIIETAIQLFGSSSNINGNCQTYVIKASRYGPDFNTLAWLEQYSICKSMSHEPVQDEREADMNLAGQSWYAVFAFWIVGSVFLVWLGVIAYTVGQATYD